MSKIECGGSLVLKHMFDLVMNVNDASLRLLTDGLQDLEVKYVPRKNIVTVVSYLKETLLLLQNCAAIPTEEMRLRTM